MTTREVIAHAQFTLETLEAKSEAEGGCVECDENAKDFLRSVIRCAEKALEVEEARGWTFKEDDGE